MPRRDLLEPEVGISDFQTAHTQEREKNDFRKGQRSVELAGIGDFKLVYGIYVRQSSDRPAIQDAQYCR